MRNERLAFKRPHPELPGEADVLTCPEPEFRERQQGGGWTMKCGASACERPDSERSSDEVR